MKYGRTVGPRSDRRSIIITLYTYVYYVCVCGGRDWEEEELNAVCMRCARI